jgi:hypothetical protein
MLVSREEAQQECAKYLALAAEQSQKALRMAGNHQTEHQAVAVAQVATASAISALAAAVLSISGYK